MSMEDSAKEEGRELYESLATETPERKAEVEGTDKSKTLEEKEEESPDLTDMQATLKKMFPSFGDEVDDALMMARISPDMFTSLIRINTNSVIKRCDPTKPLEVAKIATKYYIANSIGLDGKGRIDVIELAGSVTDAEELKEITRGMGI